MNEQVGRQFGQVQLPLSQERLESHSGQLYVHTVPAQFDNLGTGFKYSFLATGVPVPASLAEEVDAKMKGFKKSLNKFDDLKVELTKAADGTLGLTAALSYSEGIKGHNLADRIRFLLESSLWMFEEIKNDKEAAKDDWMKKKLGKLAKADFEMMAPAVVPYAREKADAAEGTWGWAQGSGNSKRSIQVDNEGDRLVMWCEAPGTSEATPDKDLETLRSWIKDEQPKDSASASLEMHAKSYWAKVEYRYEGFSPEKILGLYDKFNEKFSEKFVEKARKVAAAAEAAGASARGDFMKKTVEKLSKSEFEMALAGIVANVDDDLDGPGGSYTFGTGVDDEKRSIHVANEGDKMVLECRADGWTDANREKLVASLGEWVAKEKPAKATAASIDGSTRKSPWLHVEYVYAGNSAKDVAEFYGKFKDGFSKDFVKQSRKLAKKL